MNATTETVAEQTYTLEISRLLDAPPSLVFRAFTRPEHMVRWWGPKDYSTTAQKLEFRKDGSYRFTIHGPNNHRHGMSGAFREIVEPEKIVFTFAWDGQNGEPANETLITVTLKAEGNGTRLIFRQEPFDDVKTRDSHAGGWGEVLDKLVPFLDELRG